VQVQARVLGPDWTQARSGGFVANGVKIREATITAEDAPKGGEEEGSIKGVQWTGTWTCRKTEHAGNLVVGDKRSRSGKPFWQVREQYQPTAPTGRRG